MPSIRNQGTNQGLFLEVVPMYTVLSRSHRRPLRAPVAHKSSYSLSTGRMAVSRVPESHGSSCRHLP